ncbi:alpha/beta hydrolase [Methyloraptor flagellatus]|uniref:Alpha/beta hydrolase n=1 Tax=Methyloraptor flagellatus TaxID=3162530 RepID=A0AAU7X8J3_9HYPH
MDTLSHIHRFVPGADPAATPLLLLHGTGGDENDLLPLGRALSPGAALVSPRGRVLEHGMPRFFRRIAEGIFDEDDVRRRAGELAGFVAGARAAYGLGAPIAVGYSNGANIAAAVLLTHPGVLAGAVLIRPMQPLGSTEPVRLDGTPILMLSGARDPIVTADDVGGLAERFRAAGAAVDHRTLPTGHPLTQADVDIARAWIAEAAKAIDPVR